MNIVLLIFIICSYFLSVCVIIIVLVDLSDILLFLSVVLNVVGLTNFHIIWFLPKFEGETFIDGLSLNSKLYDIIKYFWSKNVGSDKNPIYHSLFTFQQKFYRGKLHTNYDTHFVVPNLTSSGNSSLAFYCTKYLFKNMSKEERIRSGLKMNLDEDEYLSVWDLIRSRSVMSRSFGLGASHNKDDILKYLRECVALSDRSKGYPQFFNPDTNQVFPLCPFYRNNSQIVPASIMNEFLDCKDSVFNDFEKNCTDIDIAVSEFDRISNIVDKDLSIQFDFLFE